jgi:NAD(P)-dependent dehydrogenase (short-subunit alcohol dehydrogenase family)
LALRPSKPSHATGADIFMHVRDMEKGESVKKDILATFEGKGKLELLYIDMGSFKSVREGAAEFIKKSDRLNVLVNNAGK